MQIGQKINSIIETTPVVMIDDMPTRTVNISTADALTYMDFFNSQSATMLEKGRKDSATLDKKYSIINNWYAFQSGWQFEIKNFNGRFRGTTSYTELVITKFK